MSSRVFIGKTCVVLREEDSAPISLSALSSPSHPFVAEMERAFGTFGTFTGKHHEQLEHDNDRKEDYKRKGLA